MVDIIGRFCLSRFNVSYLKPYINISVFMSDLTKDQANHLGDKSPSDHKTIIWFYSLISRGKDHHLHFLISWFFSWLLFRVIFLILFVMLLFIQQMALSTLEVKLVSPLILSPCCKFNVINSELHDEGQVSCPYPTII